MAGKYEGSAVVEFLRDGRTVRLHEPFTYIDPSSLRWPVPKDAKVDGASIPQPLWGLIGGPFEGLYRDASIIHDWYCDIRTRHWTLVHRVFYDAMLTSSVAEIMAKIMYAGVLVGGPRWNTNAIDNTNLALSNKWIDRWRDHDPNDSGGDWYGDRTLDKGADPARSPDREEKGPGVGVATSSDATYQYNLDESAVAEIQEWVQATKPTIPEIETFADHMIANLEPSLPRLGIF